MGVLQNCIIRLTCCSDQDGAYTVESAVEGEAIDCVSAGNAASLALLLGSRALLHILYQKTMAPSKTCGFLLHTMSDPSCSSCLPSSRILAIGMYMLNTNESGIALMAREQCGMQTRNHGVQAIVSSRSL